MGIQLKTWFIPTILSICISLTLFALAQQQVPCYFIFGDSSEDSGNNNHLITLAKTNYFPYGIDYPSSPTGRFTNGPTTTDFIAELLGFEDPIPPYVNTFGQDIPNGVNYASGAAGIRRDTLQILGDHVSFDGQLQNHADVVSNIFSQLGENANNYLNNCLYIVRLGSNEYLGRIPPSIYPTRVVYNPSDFAANLIQDYSQRLKTLYNYGARKIAVFGIGQVGCTPYQIASTLSTECNEETNSDARIFDAMLTQLVDSFNHNLIGAKFIFLNFTHMVLTSGPETGIINRKNPCCSVLFTTGLCIPQSIPCQNRDTHAFWDAYHPSSAFNKIVATRAYKASTEFDCYPYDINTLAQLEL